MDTFEIVFLCIFIPMCIWTAYVLIKNDSDQYQDSKEKEFFEKNPEVQAPPIQIIKVSEEEKPYYQKEFEENEMLRKQIIRRNSFKVN